MSNQPDHIDRDILLAQPALVTDLVATATGMVHHALQKAAGGEEGFAYGVSLTVVPGAQEGAFVPVLVVVLTAPSVVIGDRLFCNLLSYDIHPVQEGIEAMVGQGVERLRAQRSEMLASTV